MRVPRVDADGNELGGVPTVLRDAPLGTYLGWNITSARLPRGQVCNYIGGYIPFATTRPSVRRTATRGCRWLERYGDHAGYVAAVKAAADNALSARLSAAGRSRCADPAGADAAPFFNSVSQGEKT